jgi:L,D-peptidoglycan transpeptidase YkuD (ErfK/YbiS/YcfS/YnhG family)
MMALQSLRRILLLATLCALAACAHRQAISPSQMPWHSARQLVVVTTADWNVDHGMLRRFERDGGTWHAVGAPQPVLIGRSGSAWGIGLHPQPTHGPMKREGDGRSPAGVFAIGEAFGYATTARTALPYSAMEASSYCVDVSGSPLYNRIVDTRVVGEQAVAGATEPMRRDLHENGDQRYRLGFVIEHNPRGVPMSGSCIFAHLWKSPVDATSGCTAMDTMTMDAVLAWLRPDADPVFVLLPIDVYRQVGHGWGLPSIAKR